MEDDPLEELSRDEKQALVNLVKNDNGFDLSRRDVLALAGGASLGAVLGGTGYSAMGSAKADASTSDSDGNVGLPNDPVDAWIEGLAGPTGSPIDLASDIVPDTDASYDLGSSSNQFANAYMRNAEVESLNKEVYMDPAESDFGSALADAESRVSDHGVIYVPPVEYAQGSGHTLSKSVGIIGLGQQTSGVDSDRLYPLIMASSDTPMIEGANQKSLYIDGLAIDYTNVSSPTARAIVAHGRAQILNCYGFDLGNDFIYLHQEGSNDNLNVSHIWNVSARSVQGDVVFAENTSGEANNINSIRVFVNNAFNHSGWGINTGGSVANGSVFLVNNSEGSNGGGGIRMNSQRCVGRVMRNEGNGPVYEFNNARNYGDVLYNLGDSPVWNDNLNIYHEITTRRTTSTGLNKQIVGSGSPLEVFVDGDLSGDYLKVTDNGAAASAVSAVIEIHDQNRTNSGYLYLDTNGDIIAEDADGNETVLT
jgi:hypothetical protein